MDRYDIIVVGGGPAGSQAAISAATEGMEVALVEPDQIGGEIAQSPRLENLAGYPYGIPGDLFGRALRDQMFELGVEIIEAGAERLDPTRRAVTLTDRTLFAHNIIIATGERFVDFHIKGAHEPRVHLGPGDALALGPIVRNECIAIIGGGNSAGQAIEYLGNRAEHLHVIAPELSTSHYLTDRIERMDRVEVDRGRVVEFAPSDDGLSVRIDSSDSPLIVDRAFLCVGLRANTDWLPLGMTNPTGHVPATVRFHTVYSDIYAIGSVRLGSTSRVPVALGEGASVITEIQQLSAARDAA